MENFLVEINDYLEDMELLQSDVYEKATELPTSDAGNISDEHRECSTNLSNTCSYVGDGKLNDTSEIYENETELQTISCGDENQDYDICENKWSHPRNILQYSSHSVYHYNKRDYEAALLPTTVSRNLQDAPESSKLGKLQEALTATKYTKKYNYRVCYDVELPNTIDGYMIQLEGTPDQLPFVFDYKVCFQEYRKHKGDITSEIEKDKVLRHQYDILLAVNGTDVAGKHVLEVQRMINLFKMNTETSGEKIKLTFLNRDSFNALSYITCVFEG